MKTYIILLLAVTLLGTILLDVVQGKPQHYGTIEECFDECAEVCNDECAEVCNEVCTVECKQVCTIECKPVCTIVQPQIRGK